VTARRAVMRWAVRTVRREWRQQILVLTLLTVAVAAAIGFASAAYNIAPTPGNAEFGTANHALELEETDVAAARQWFGTIDVIGHRQVAVPGRFEPLDFRAQDPRGPHSEPLLALRSGQYPSGDEVAVTAGLAKELVLHVGATLSVDGNPRSVVGIVENPSDLGDEFALLAPTGLLSGQPVTVLVDAERDHVRSFRPPGNASRRISVRGDLAEDVAAAVSVLGVAVVALFFVGLLASAGFVVIAQRRQRQLGVLAAIGATERNLRIAMIANGMVVGAVAAGAGAVLGIAGWIAAEPRIESAAGYRLERFDIPWWVIAAGMVLAVVAATGASWWPARVAARASIVQALSGRPARPRAVHRSAATAAVLVVVGVACLAASGDVANDTTVSSGDVALVASGTVATIVGVLLLCPLALRLLARAARPLPIGARLALRDLARFQARSGSALAAIVMALGIPTAVVIAAGAAEHSASAGNLPTDTLVVRGDFNGPFIPEAAAIGPMQAQVDRVAAALGAVGVTRLDVALDPGFVYEPTEEGRIAVTLVERASEGWRDLSLMYVATPALLADGPPGGFVTSETGELGILGVAQPSDTTRRKVEPLTDATAVEPGYSSLPGSFVTGEEVRRRGWQTVASGRWLLRTEGAATDEQLSTAREVAAAGGLTIEVRDDQAGLGTLRSGATAVGMLLALGVLAMTVGLIRSEAAPDLRTLTATGATRRTRRALTATTAAALAGLGVALAMAGAGLVLSVGYLHGPVNVPVAHLLLIALGTPIVAAGAGWLLAGGEPPAVSRPAMA
jgi:putative ABC transport system permease protein